MKCDGCQYYGQDRAHWSEFYSVCHGFGVCDDISQIVIANCKMLLQIESKLISNFHKLQSEIIWAVQVHLYPLRERCTCFPEALFVPSSGKVYSVPKTRDFVHLSRKSALFPGKWIFWDSLLASPQWTLVTVTQ